MSCTDSHDMTTDESLTTPTTTIRPHAQINAECQFFNSHASGFFFSQSISASDSRLAPVNYNIYNSSLPPGDPDTVSLSPPPKSLCRTRMLATVCGSRSVLTPSNLHIRDVRNLTKCNEKPLLRSDTGVSHGTNLALGGCLPVSTSDSSSDTGATSDGSSMFASLQRASKFTGLRTFTAFCYACCQATSAPSPVTTPVTPSGRGSLNPTWRQHQAHPL